MNFQDAILSGFRNYVGFAGRAARSEYWYWVLFALLVGIVTSILDAAIFPDADFGPLNAVSSLILLLPGIAVAARRLHDIDYSGWWLLLAFTLIGLVVLVIWFCMRGTSGPNRFGPDPLGAG
jgi:uncharacterized membrane protein YhaH (DUF805 family)